MWKILRFYGILSYRGDFMHDKTIDNILEILKEKRDRMTWEYHDVPNTAGEQKMYRWPGREDESIIVTLHRSRRQEQLFHHHDYFYFNYTYKGQYEAHSQKHGNVIQIKEGEIYAGQPYAGHILLPHDDDAVIVCVLIKPGALYDSFLSFLSEFPPLIRFILEPSTSTYSEEIIHLKTEGNENIRLLLEMMMEEYAYSSDTTQTMLKAQLAALLVAIAREHSKNQKSKNSDMAGRLLRYIDQHIADVTLKSIGAQFSYHPNYISSVIHKELGKTFSTVLTERRMIRAASLLKGTDLSVAKVADMVGYTDASNFHKAFKEYYSCSPREFAGLSR